MTLGTLLLVLSVSSQVVPTAPGSRLEGRPLPANASPLQGAVDAADPGDTVVVEAGTYVGDLLIDRPIRLLGRGRPRLVGSGSGSIVLIRADEVTFEGFDIDAEGRGDLGRDSSGIHIAAERAVVRDCRIENAIFGIYLREAHGATVERCHIRGIRGKPPGEQGSGIHVWNTHGFRLADNDVAHVRDGFYIQSSPNGEVIRNVARELRYGLHYMYSDDNRFEDNRFEDGDAGAAIMYSRRISFRRNRFVHNRGFASVGLLLKTCDDVVAENNLIADNARGIFMEGSYRNVIRGNVIAESDVAIVLFDSSAGNRFEGNSFVANLTPLTLVGRRTDTVFDGNFWSDNDEPDLDGDGRSDRPYRLSSVFDHLRGNLTAADLFSRGFAASAMAAAERAFPVLDPLPVIDRVPLARPPRLPRVPASRPAGGARDGRGVVLSVAALLAGLGALRKARL